MDSISQLSRQSSGKLAHQLHNMKELAKKHRVKERAQHGAKVLVGVAMAAAGGVVAGGLQLKMPTIPRTKLRTDLSLGAALAAAAAGGLFGDMDHQMADMAKGLVGAGMAGASSNFLQAHGVVKSA